MRSWSYPWLLSPHCCHSPGRVGCCYQWYCHHHGDWHLTSQHGTQANLHLQINGTSRIGFVLYSTHFCFKLNQVITTLPATFSMKLDGTRPLFPFKSSPSKNPSYTNVKTKSDEKKKENPDETWCILLPKKYPRNRRNNKWERACIVSYKICK